MDGSIFNSFHVTFLECLDEQPVDLLPGTMIYIEPNATPSWDAPPCSDAQPPILSPPMSSTSPNSDISSPTLPSSSCISPGENCCILMPGPNCLDSLDTAPPLCRSTHLHTPSSHLAMDNGLLPSCRLSEAISDSTSAAAHWHSSWTSKCSPLSDNVSDQLLTELSFRNSLPFGNPTLSYL